MRNCLFYLSLLLIWLRFDSLCAYTGHFMLTDKELSCCMINNIHQDRDGMIWISTENGLNRYDGTKVTVFSHIPGDSTSLAHNYVRYFFEDHAGNCYVGSYLGLQLFRPDTDDFSPMATFSDGTNLISSPSFITENSEGQVIVSGNRACRVHLLPDGHLRYDSLAWGMSTRMPGEVAWGRDGNLWFYVSNDAIYCVHRSGMLERRRDLLPQREILNLVRDADGNIYIQTSDKDLYAYDFESGDCYLLNRERISFATIKCVYRLDEGHFLLGTDGNGVKLLDLRTGGVTDWVVDLPGLSSKSLKVHQIVRDRDGDLWLGLFLKGVVRIPMKQSYFRYIGPYASTSSNLVGSSSISTLLSSRDGKIWVGTDGDGAYCLDPQLGQSVHLKAHTDGGSVPTILNTLFEDSEGTIWAGTYDEGCGRIDPRSHRYVSCRNLFNRQGANAIRVYGFAEDRQHRIWVATLGSGLFCYDLKKKAVIEELSYEDGVNRWATNLLVTSDHLLLVGTYDGVFMLDLKQPKPTPVHLFDKSIVYALYEDMNHHFWAGSSVGLIEFDREGQRLSTYTDADGLTGSAAYSVIGDNEGVLWIGTDQGLTRFDILNRSFSSFSDADGLQGRSFSKNAACRDSLGLIWMGGPNGINCFHPSLVRRQDLSLQVRVSGFYLHNKPVHANTLSGGLPIYEGPVSHARRFELDYNDNNFSIELSTYQFVDANLVRYQYSMGDDQWMTLPLGGHIVNFSNLPVGTYTFRCRATTNTQVSPELSLTVVVRPAWWATRRAKLLYLLAGLLLLSLSAYGVYRQQKNRRREELLRLQVDENARKEEFFHSLTHEIRTPMSLLLNLLQQLISTDNDPERQQKYHSMQISAERLVSQTDQMLGLHKTETDEPAILPGDPQLAPPADTNVYVKYRMMIVADNQELLDTVRAGLESDFKVETCANSQEALDRVFRHAPDILICDASMPDLEGYALCERLKSNARLCHIPIILLTAKSDTNSMLRGLGLGADAYVSKPFYIEMLRTTAINLVRGMVRLRNSLAEVQQSEQPQETQPNKSFNDKLYERMLAVVNEHLSDPEFSIEQLCSEVGISRVHLYRKLKEIANQTPGEFVRNCRLHQAERMLLQGNLSVQEVSDAVGFSKASNFSLAFKEVYGYPPLRWRKMHLEEQESS